MTVTAVSQPAVRTRVASLDILRGAVMILMAIDHVRVYSGVPAGGPTAGVFLTRWVTHFCAPVFVFLAGTAAFLYGRAIGDRRKLAAYLVTRGALLIVFELTVIRASWTFGVDYSGFLLAGVIWMLGWCMILLAALVWMPTWVVGTLGIAIVALQDGFGPLGRALPPSLQVIWEFLYPIGIDVTLGAGGPSVAVLYSIVPWIGVMAAGYGFGAIVVRDDASRTRLMLRIGLSATALFLLAAIASALQADEGAPALWMRVLNQRKYPASPLYLLMTLGPAIALLPFAERARGRVATLLETVGRVPMFYYLLHIPIIHALALIVWQLRTGSMHPEWFATAPYTSVPPAERWGLPLLYLVFATAVAVLYPLCRAFARVKASGRHPLLRYL
jgi:uncharacterized membrane protein